ncbi:hypothetical protein NQZ68_015608 [Dissostichus eleginoides]|nr:hypothetical protein NQZ68_015608 [Dissostichus eleginoides]
MLALIHNNGRAPLLYGDVPPLPLYGDAAFCFTFSVGSTVSLLSSVDKDSEGRQPLRSSALAARRRGSGEESLW